MLIWNKQRNNVLHIKWLIQKRHSWNQAKYTEYHFAQFLLSPKCGEALLLELLEIGVWCDTVDLRPMPCIWASYDAQPFEAITKHLAKSLLPLRNKYKSYSCILSYVGMNFLSFRLQDYKGQIKFYLYVTAIGVTTFWKLVASFISSREDALSAYL